MDQKRIIEIFNAKSAAQKKQCAKYAQIFKFFREISADIVSAEISAENIPFRFGWDTCQGKTPEGYPYTQILARSEGWPNTGNTITVKTTTGQYSTTIPVNEFYHALCSLLNIPTSAAAPVMDNAVFTATVSGAIGPKIARAAKFCSCDTLRPAMTGTLLEFSPENFKIVSTDAHRLYISPKFTSTSTGTFQAIIAAADAKNLGKCKAENFTFSFSADKVMISAGAEIFTFRLIDARFPDYTRVIPDYTQFMEFSRADLLQNIKVVIPAANKVTNQVNFHLNGAIELSAQDIDFETECKFTMPYTSKTFPDTDIAFNGKLLSEILKEIHTKTAKMYTAGCRTKAAIFRPADNSETILLMPLMVGI